MLGRLGGLIVGCALALWCADSYAAPHETKLCDLGELLRTPEKIATSDDCAGFYVKVADQPISCGLYDKLSDDMKASWVTTAEEVCGTSESCSEVMAQCAARQISGKDLRGEGASSSSFTSSSSEGGSNSSQVTVERSRGSSSSSPQVSRVKGGNGSAATTTVLRGSARGGQPNSQTGRSNLSDPGIFAARAASQSSTTSAASSSSSSSAGSSSSSSTPDCYVCIYDALDPVLTKANCEVKAKEARRRGIRNVIVADSMEALYDKKYHGKICGCKNIDTLVDNHGSPGGEKLPFDEIRTLIEVAPQCSNIKLHNLRCSGFDSVTAAVAEAKKLSQEMAKSGYSGTVTVTGNQTVTHEVAPAAQRIAMMDIQIKEVLEAGLDDNPLGQLLARALIAPKRIMSVVAIKQMDRRVLAESKYMCDMTNTPIGFQVCASGVSLALSPCETPGHVSVIDKGSNGNQTIVCAKDGKRANQRCSFVKLNEVPDLTLSSGDKLVDRLKERGYGEDGCDSGQTCLCKWEEPSVCSS